MQIFVSAGNSGAGSNTVGDPSTTASGVGPAPKAGPGGVSPTMET